MAKLVISKKELIKLYINKKLPSTKICEWYKCCKTTILKRLHEHKILLRHSGSRRVIISKYNLEHYYSKKKLSSRRIARFFNCHYSTIDRQLKKYSILTRNRAESHIIYPRRDFSGNVLEKSYLIGFAVGDLRVRKVHPYSETISVACGTTRYPQVRLFKALFEHYGKVWTKRCKNKVNMEAYLNLSFSFLLNKNFYWIFNKNNTFYAFLAGFTDAEGSIFITAGKANYSLGNYDYKLLKKICEKLTHENINCTKLISDNLKGYVGKDGYKRNQDYWHFNINRKRDLLYVFSMLKPYIRHSDKIMSMKRAKTNIINRNKKFGNLRMGD